MLASPLTRRSFCTMAAAATTAAARSAERKIRVAVLGTGHAHALGKIRALRSMSEFEFAGICCPDADEPQQGEVSQGVRWLSLDELLGDSSIPLVAVESRV